MTPADELSGLYQQWRSLTDDERGAIQAGDWKGVENYQAAKAQLKTRITELSQRLDAITYKGRFGRIVEELMELERHNSALVQRRRQAAEAQMQELDRASRHLRQLHKFYAPPSRTHWQSYS